MTQPDPQPPPEGAPATPTRAKLKWVVALAGATLVALLQLTVYDAARKAPAWASPGRLLLWSIFGFVGLNIAFFSFNLLKTLWAARKLKDEAQLEETVVPALQGDVTDERLARYFELPVAFLLGSGFAGLLFATLRQIQSALS